MMNPPINEFWKAMVVAGPEKSFVRSPACVAFGPEREGSDKDGLARDADEVERIFFSCPESQRGVAAQAIMSMGKNWNDK